MTDSGHNVRDVGLSVAGSPGLGNSTAVVDQENHALHPGWTAVETAVSSVILHPLGGYFPSACVTFMSTFNFRQASIGTIFNEGRFHNNCFGNSCFVFSLLVERFIFCTDRISYCNCKRLSLLTAMVHHPLVV